MMNQGFERLDQDFEMAALAKVSSEHAQEDDGNADRNTHVLPQTRGLF